MATVELNHIPEHIVDPDARPAPQYWGLAREPLACLVFLLPLLAIYELGVLWVESGQSKSIRNGADFWMRSLLVNAGVDAVVLPVAIVGILLVWHRCGGYPWRISRETLYGMFGESLLLAVCLLFVAQLQDMAFQCWFPGAVEIHSEHAGERPLLAIESSLAPQLISYIGAGVYEEMMFRLGLLPACLIAFRVLFRMPKRWAAGLAVFVTSLIFSVAHYLGPAGEAFSLFSFTFRVTAGCFFATVFLLRGFGITVGCHALYDVLVGLLTAGL